ncbi:MAG: MFS transporter [Vulcanisaeta sp.]
MDSAGILDKVRMKAILSAYLGWVMDGYDALLVTPIMPLLGQLFFPGPYSLIGGLSTLVATLVGRPLGSVIMGWVGDAFGRRIGLLITVLGYSLTALAIALMPTYAVAGILSPISILILRFLQGIFLGGEWGPGTALIMEWSRWRRELTSAFVQSGYPIGVIIATIVNTLFIMGMGLKAFNSYGWRIYMATGAVVALLAFIIRNRLVESPLWSRPRENPLRMLFTRGGLWLGFGVIFTGGLLTIYYSTYLIYSDFLIEVLHEPYLIPSVMLTATIAAVIAVLLAGPLATIINYRLVIIGTLVLAMTYAPIALILQPGFVNLVLLAFIENFAMGLVPYLLIDKFDIQYRASALGVSYNWGLLIGGWAPMLVALIRPMNHGMVIIMAVGVVLAIIGVLALSRKH